MTLHQMASLICQELGLFDETSFALTKAFLSKNYIMIWDKYPWLDTQTIREVTVPAGDDTVELPGNICRVISIRATTQQVYGPSGDTRFRSDSRFLDPVNSTFLVQTDPEILNRGGYAKYYEEIIDLSHPPPDPPPDPSPPDPPPRAGTRAINIDIPTPLPSTVAANWSLRLYPTPIVDTVLKIVGKRWCPGFVVNQDASSIRNIDPAIMAYTYFDMLQRQRQYGKADLKRKEALELEGEAWALEQQQVNRPRLTKATTAAGNSLAEMTDAVCVLCGQWAPDYRLAIQEFLRRNYQALYDTFLWPESLVVVRVPYTTEQVIMPPYVDKVIGIRGTADTRMFPAEAGLLLDITPSVFDQIGDPVSYTTLTPVAVATLPPAATGLLLASSTFDTCMVTIRGEVIATGTEIEEQIQLNGAIPVRTAYDYDVPLTIAKDITVGDVTVNASADNRNLVVIPANRRELKHQRLWFLPVPDQSKLIPTSSDPNAPDAFVCLVLAKRAIHPLVTDEDTPIITGVQQVLIAAAAADIFRKLEKPDQAAAMLQKADGSMAVLKNKNFDQAASSPRFVPQVEPRAYIGAAECVW